MPNKKLKLELDLDLMYDPKRSKNTMHMYFGDTDITISDTKTKKVIGHIRAAMGGGIDVQDDRTHKIWTMSAKDLWLAYQRALDSKKR